MFRRNKKTRKYQVPTALVTQMALESNFCQTVLFNVQAKDLENMNAVDPSTMDEAEVFYFES